MFLVKHKICKCWLHYGAASIETFLKGASNKKSLGTAVVGQNCPPNKKLPEILMRDRHLKTKRGGECPPPTSYATDAGTNQFALVTLLVHLHKFCTRKSEE